MRNPVFGQEEIQGRLFREIQHGQMPHALLLHGPSGCGKLAIAIAYAQSILCSHRTAEGEGCGECQSCKMVGHLVHPDLHFVFPVIRSKSGSTPDISDDHIKEWRALVQKSPYFDLSDWQACLKANGNIQATIYTVESDSIQRKMALKPALGEHKAMIICWPEKMMTECANKLLKLIEEPPSNTHFIFVSEEPARIIPTLISRMQRIELHAVTKTDLIRFLVNHKQLPSDQAENIASQSNGSLSQALKILNNENNDNAIYFNLFTTLMRASWRRDVKAMRTWSEELADKKREQQLNFFNYCLYLLRENFIYNFHIKNLNSMTAQEAEFAVRFAPFIHERNVILIKELFEKCFYDLQRQVNAKMVFFNMTLQISVLIRK